MRRIAFVNEKGGTCKTTLTVNVGAWLARARRASVLLVDLDTQGHAAKSLGIDVRGLSPTLHNLLVRSDLPLSEVIRPTAVPRLDVIPANKTLAEYPIEVAADPRRAERLRDRLAPLEGYDYVLFDCPPSMGLMTTSAMLAADELVLPVATTYLALDGCAEVMETVRRVRPDLRVTSVVPTLYRKTQLADEILAKLREYFPTELSCSVLGYNVQIDEAQSHGLTIWEYAPSSKGAQTLQAIAEEIELRGGSAAHDEDEAPREPDVVSEPDPVGVE